MLSAAAAPGRGTRAAGRLAGAFLLAATCAAQAGTESAGITINLNVLSQSNCRFTTLPPALMDFGVLDLASTVPISLSVPAIMECKGTAPVATYAVSLGNGLHHDGSTRRMQHTTAVAPTFFLPYSASVAPAAGTVAKNTPVDLTVTATIPVASFQQAPAGLYSDTITLTVQP